VTDVPRLLLRELIFWARPGLVLDCCGAIVANGAQSPVDFALRTRRVSTHNLEGVVEPLGTGEMHGLGQLECGAGEPCLRLLLNGPHGGRFGWCGIWRRTSSWLPAGAEFTGDYAAEPHARLIVRFDFRAALERLRRSKL
jgi:hypothetical protein